MFKLYSDLLLEIDSYKTDIRLDIIARDKLFSILNPNSPHDMKGMNYDGMPKGSPNFTTLDRLYERNRATLEIINQIIEHKQQTLSEKEKEKNEMEEEFKKFDGLYHKVFDLHRIQHKPLKEVANILGYTYVYVKDINYKIQKEIMNDKQTTFVRQTNGFDGDILES